MPKVVLTERQKKQELMKRYIRAHMAYQGLDNYTKTAAAIGIGDRAFLNKINGVTEWTWRELRGLFDVLKFTDQEILEVM